jgi:hypothetical protein
LQTWVGSGAAPPVPPVPVVLVVPPAPPLPLLDDELEVVVDDIELDEQAGIASAAATGSAKAGTR